MSVVKGHGLISEGAGYPPGTEARSALARYWGTFHEPAGVGLCRCGATSDPLPSNAARKRWHREHKQAVLDAAGTA